MTDASPEAMQPEEVAALERKLGAAKRLLALKEARTSLKAFIRLMMPDPDNPDDVSKSRYQETPQGDYLCKIIEETAAGERRRTGVSMPPQHGKPVAETELVLMGDGSRKMLRDVAVGDEVISHTGAPRRVEAVYVQGNLDCLKVKTDLGRECVAAPDHPFLTPDGWVPLGDLSAGDHLACVLEPRTQARVSMSAGAQARLLGYVVGDGSVTKNGSTIGATITSVDLSVQDDIVACAQELGFSATVKTYARRAPSVLLSGGIRPFLREHALAGCSSWTKRVPEWVFAQDADTVAEFLGAYFACDGTINSRGGARRDGCAEFYSVNRALLEDVQHLLLRVGVRSRLAQKNGRYKGEVHKSHRLSVTSQHDAAVFAERVPIKGGKSGRLAGWGLRRDRFEHGLLADKIVSIEPVGAAPCRCLMVETDRSFTAADLVVHNTEHLAKMGVAWLIGQDPTSPIIVATYNEVRAGELGEEVLGYMNSSTYRQVFPDVELAKGSKSKTSMRTTLGGRIVFTGKGGTITGRSAKHFIIDDPIKDDEEAQSDDLREKLWKWFFSVAYSRGSNKTSIIILHTRWHEDDLLGRLCDEDHPERNGRFKGIAKDWTYINIPGVVTDETQAAELGLTLKRPLSETVIEQFGDKPMSALWERERDLDHFAQWRRGDARTFDALVMGKPSPDEGVYFLEDWLVEYEPHELPPESELRFYGASDHAVSTKQGRDYTVLGCVAVDKDDNVWVLPDVVWERMETDKTVEELLLQFKTHKPQLWWMESELISKSFGPFLKQRMLEERVYTTLAPVTPTKDKATRARAIQGRMAMKKVRFPKSAPWWSRARSQILRFPNAANDDFVDWMSHIGGGLLRLHGPSPAREVEDNVVRVGSIEWILKSSKRRAEREQREKKAAGW